MDITTIMAPRVQQEIWIWQVMTGCTTSWISQVNFKQRQRGFEFVLKTYWSTPPPPPPPPNNQSSALCSWLILLNRTIDRWNHTRGLQALTCNSVSIQTSVTQTRVWTEAPVKARLPGASCVRALNPTPGRSVRKVSDCHYPSLFFIG